LAEPSASPRPPHGPTTNPPGTNPRVGAPGRIALPEGVRPGGRFDAWDPAPISYVVCDVDGTLVGPSAHASDEVVAAVAHAQRSGVRVGFATGRMRGAVEPLYAQLRAHGPHVLHNGAEVRADGTTVARWTLTPGQVDALIALARTRDDAYIEIYTEEGYHTSSLDERAVPHWELLGGRPTSVVASAADLGEAPVLKATFAVFEPEGVAAVVDAVRELGLAAGPAGSPRTPGIIYCNATHPEADKGRALLRACDHLGIDPAACAAIGDADNDRPMLEIAGTAIAMGQADDELHRLAHLVVPDVDAHGVAVALELAVAHASRPAPSDAPRP
jgi:Cof subfamily protein (haloacid dehalogenase superfamily)